MLKWANVINNATLRYLAFNYSDNEVGLRHPVKPLGFMVRDVGAVDVYAGPTRFLLGENGVALLRVPEFIVTADVVRLLPSEISKLDILGKSINEEIFDGKPVVLSGVSSFEGLALVGPHTTDSQGGPLLNTVPLADVISIGVLFERIARDEVLPYDLEALLLMEGSI